MAYNKIVYGSQVLIDLTGDTVAADKLLAGYTAHDKTGELVNGICDYDADTSDATAVAEDILAGKYAYVKGVKVAGGMSNKGAVAGTIATKDAVYTIPAGYHDGSGTVQISETERNKIISSNIKQGVRILGTDGTYSGSSVTAQSKNVTPTTSQQIVQPDAGYDYLSQVTVGAIPYSEAANSAGGTTVTIGG